MLGRFPVMIGSDSMGCGHKFKEQREKLGYTLDAVEEETKIRKLYLDALERDNYVILPPRVYATGFVKRYARFLNLDEEEMVAAFKEMAYGNEPEKPEEIVAEPQQDFRFNWKNMMAAVMFLIIAVWVGTHVVNAIIDRSTEQGDSGVPGIEQREEAADEPGKNLADDSEPGKDEGKKAQVAEVRIEAHNPCWIQATVDGENEYRGILASGQSKLFKGEQSVSLVLGNAGGVDIYYNGEKMPSPGSTGQRVEKIFTVSEHASQQQEQQP